jgi:putative membrane protein
MILTRLPGKSSIVLKYRFDTVLQRRRVERMRGIMRSSYLSLFALLVAISFTSPRVHAADQPPSPAAFVKIVANTDLLEIQLGKVAQKNSTNSAVKMFGNCMIEGHTKINQDLSTVAASQGIPIPTALNVKGRAVVAKLSSLQGAAFDEAYIPAMVTGHTGAVTLFKAESAECSNAAVKAFAQRTTPIIEDHLAMAKKVQAALK